MRSSSLLALVLVAAPAAAQNAAPEVTQARDTAIDARLSPDGERIAYRARADGAVRLFVRDVSDSTAAPIARTPESTPVDAYAWTPDGRHLVFLGADDGHLHVVDSDTAGPAGPPRDLTPDVDGPTRLAGFAADPHAALIEVPGRWPDAPDLLRVDVRTGESTTVVVNDGGVLRWLPDDAGDPWLAVRGAEEGAVELVRRRDGVSVPIYRCAPEEICEPAGFHPDGRIWLRTNRGRAAPALVLLDPLMLEEEIVRADLTDDPEAAFRSDSLFDRDSARLRTMLGAVALEFQSPRADGARMLVTARDSAGATLLLFDRWAGRLTRLLMLESPSESPLRAAAAAPSPDPSVLRPMRLSYRITESDPQGPAVDVERRIERISVRRRAAWRIVDLAEVPVYATVAPDPGSLPDADELEPRHESPPPPRGTAQAADTVLLDAGTLRPISRRAGGALTIRLDFDDRRVRGMAASGGFEVPVDLALEAPIRADGAGLELLVAALPLDEDYGARFTMFDAEALAPVVVDLVVTDAQQATTPAGDFDAWRVTITPVDGEGGRHEWLVRRDAPHYMLRAITRAGDFISTTELTDAGDLP